MLTIVSVFKQFVSLEKIRIVYAVSFAKGKICNRYQGMIEFVQQRDSVKALTQFMSSPTG